MARLFGILVTVVLAMGAAVVTWPVFFGVARHAPVAQIISFRPVILFGFAVLLVLALLLALSKSARGFAMSVAMVAVVAIVANAAILGMRGFGSQDLPAATDTSVRVLTWNTAGDATSAEEIAQLAVESGADIVTLPETTIDTGEQVAILMRELGQPMWAHHTSFAQWDAASTTILIAPHLGDYSVITSSQDGSNNTSTVPSAIAMPVSGMGPTVVAVHAVAPRLAYMQDWRNDLQWLADQCASGNVILAGDFNATIDHMGGLGIDTGTLGRCTDAAAATGNGVVGTWPTDQPALVGAPIDHVMASPEWVATGSIVFDDRDGSGSDHRPLLVQLEPAPSP